MSRNRKSFLVIGAGISGLCAAYWLSKEGFEVTLLEKDNRPGGTMHTVNKNGFLIDVGPNSALETTPLFNKLFSELNLIDQSIYANQIANKRYILKQGRLHPIPMSVGSFVRTKLWSTKGKLRLLQEPFIGRTSKEESIAEFVERRLGSEFLDYAINPFVAGVYAGNPDELSVRSAFPKLYRLEELYGGLIKGFIKGRKERKRRAEQSKQSAKMFSFLNGMSIFPNTIAQALNSRIYFDTEAVVINRKKSFFEVSVKSKTRRKKFRGENVILATPSYLASQLLKEISPSIARILRGIYYPPVTLVYFGYRRDQIKHPLDGFGFLVPEKEKRRILGTIWSSTIFPNRAPEQYAAFTTFVGGARQPEIAKLSNKELEKVVHQELSSILNIDAVPEFVYIRKWTKAIPQYKLGYSSVVKSLEEFEQSEQGIYFCSNYLGGISVGDCVMNAHRIVKTILDKNQ